MSKPTVRQVTGVLAVTCLVGMAAGPASAATTVGVTPPDDDPRFGGPGFVGVTGDQRANDIAVGFDRKREVFVVEDTTAAIRTQDCSRLTNHKVRCKADPADHKVSVHTAENDDRIRIRRGVKSDTLLNGQEGDDVVTGGLRHDGIFEGSGDDRLKGRAGEDFIEGGTGDDIERGGRGGDSLGGNDLGVDRFVGGRGRDFLETIDKTVDAVIDCGRGHRQGAFVDSAEVSRVTRCQDVQPDPFSRDLGRADWQRMR